LALARANQEKSVEQSFEPSVELSVEASSQEQSVDLSVEPSIERFVEVSSNKKYNGPLATINAEGLVEETAEVKAATKAFFEIYNAQLALARANQEQSVEQSFEPSVELSVEASSQKKYNGPLATINAEGLVEETAEVKAATKAFFEIYNAQLAPARANQEQSVEQSFEPSVELSVEATQQKKYDGPLATINAEGLVEETAEVKAAAKAFFEAYNAHLALIKASQKQSVEPLVETSVASSVSSSVAPSAASSVEVSSIKKYDGPLATINAEGLVEETAEVKAAAKAFFEAYQKALKAAASAETQSQAVQKSAETLPVSTIAVASSVAPSAASSVEVASIKKYDGPLATINAEGLIENTPEVKAAAQAFFEAYQQAIKATASAAKTQSQAVQDLINLFLSQ